MDLILKMGAVLTFLSVLALIYALVALLAKLPAVSAFAIGGSIFLACGLILDALGIVAIYVGKIYQETKDRPRFRIEKTVPDTAFVKDK